MERGACGEHVIDQQQAASLDRLGRPEAEGLTEVCKASRSGQRCLSRLVRDSDQIGI